MLQSFCDWVVYGVFRIQCGSKLAEVLNFFIYDSLKILLLLFVMIMVMGFLRTFMPQDKLKSWLSKRGIAGNFYASLFGAITPFCSCSSIPIFLGFLKAGVPLGITFSFLITSPIINEYLVVLMLGFFGYKITIAYIVSGMLIGIISGAILGRMKLEKYVISDFSGFKEQPSADYSVFKTFKERFGYGLFEAKDIVKKIWVWVLLGVAAGAFIHNYVPQETVQKIIAKAGFFGVPIAVLIGVPMYGSCAAIVPIAVVLFEKGIPLGTALSFMMAIAALSLPEAMILKRAMKLKLVFIFFGIVTLGIIVTGYLFNFLQVILV